MAKDTTVDMDLSGLEDFLRALKEEGITVEVGVPASKDARPDGKSNSEIGTVHEFGNPAKGLPIRSFLRIPLSQNLRPKIENSKIIDEATLKEAIREKSLMPLAEKVGELALEVVMDAFDQQGPGWVPWKTPGYQSKTGLLLQDSQSLKQAISSEVKKK